MAEIVLSDKNDPDKNIIEGSRIAVSTLDSDVLSMAPAVTPGTPTGKTIRVNIESPSGIREDLVTGALWYQIDVKSNAKGLSKELAASVNAAVKDWNDNHKYHSKAEIDRDGGVSIQVIGDDVDAAKVEGFTVTVTLLQTAGSDTGALLREYRGRKTEITDCQHDDLHR